MTDLAATAELSPSSADRLNPLSKTLFESAQKASQAYTKVRSSGLEKTAEAIEFEIYPPSVEPNDQNRLLASQAISDIAYGAQENFRRILVHNQDTQGPLSPDLVKVDEYLKNISTLLSATPDTQFVAIHKAMAANINHLMENHKEQIHEPLQEAAKHPDQYDPQIKFVLERQNKLEQASQELIASGQLKTDVDTLTEIAYAPEVGKK